MADEQVRPEDGNGKLHAPLVLQIIFDPNTGQASLNSNVKDKRMIINLLTTGLNIINNSEEQKSNIIIPQTRVKI